MIERTQKKLREAKFFLDHLAQLRGSDPDDAAEFYLSAFLSAARSVTNVLESEEPIYRQWSPAWQATLTEAERQLLAKFTSARNRALKQGTPTVKGDPIAQAATSALSPELQFFFFEMIADDGAPVGPNRVLKGRQTPKYAEEELIPICRKYFDLLSRLVTAFRERPQ
jgi:hypothetical protein